MAEASELQVHMFGEFSLSYGGQTIADQHTRSGKLWTSLAYLITFREKEISQTEMIELLWPGEDGVSAPANTLKTLLHRARAQVAQLDGEKLRNTISYHRGTYQWLPSVPYRVDVDDFDKLCKDAATEEDTSRKLSMLLEAVDLYKGDFLPRSALESWVMPINMYYRSQYLKIVCDVLDLLAEAGNPSRSIDVCQKAIVIDPYDEKLHLCLIKSLLATGDQRGALQHYKHVTDLFFTQFGVSPSDEMTAIYREVVQTDRDMELDLNIIKENLQEIEPSTKAYECEYEFFKEFYRLEARSVFRTGQSIYIALITIASSSAQELTQKQLNSTMDRLREVIANSLRRSDVVSRYSVTQYLMMLPSASFENSQTVLNRIVTAFRSQYPKMPVMLQYRILPLDPLPV